MFISGSQTTTQKPSLESCICPLIRRICFQSASLQTKIIASSLLRKAAISDVETQKTILHLFLMKIVTVYIDFMGKPSCIPGRQIPFLLKVSLSWIYGTNGWGIFTVRISSTWSRPQLSWGSQICKSPIAPVYTALKGSRFDSIFPRLLSTELPLLLNWFTMISVVLSRYHLSEEPDTLLYLLMTSLVLHGYIFLPRKPMPLLSLLHSMQLSLHLLDHSNVFVYITEENTNCTNSILIVCRREFLSNLLCFICCSKIAYLSAATGPFLISRDACC